MSTSPSLELEVRKHIAPFFSHKSLENGLRYARQNRVSDTCYNYDTPDEIEITADVLGSDSRPYQVSILIFLDGESIEIDSDCTCPVGSNCKHGVAAFAVACQNKPALLDNFKDQFEPRQLVTDILRLSGRNPLATSKIPPTSPSPTLGYELENWLSNLNKSTHPPAPPKPIEPRALFFILPQDDYQDRNHYNPGTSFSLKTCKKLKGGNWNSGSDFPITSKASATLSALPEPELQLLRLLHGNSKINNLYLGERTLCRKFGTQFLLAALQINRLALGTTANPLTLGPPRKGRLDWILDDEGVQRAGISVDPPASRILRLDPPFYVDASTSSCGPLEIDASPATIIAWLASPAIRPSNSKLVAQKISALSLPPVKQIPLVTLPPVAPIPVLRLWGYDLPSWQIPRKWSRYTNSSLRIGVATLQFEYDGLRVFANDRLAFLEKYRNGRFERIPRNLSAETPNLQAISAILTCLADPKSQFPIQSFQYPIGASFILDSVKSPEEMISIWSSFAREAIPSLQQRGWKIEYEDSFEYRYVQPDDWFSDASPDSSNNWFDIELGVLVDGQRINLLPLLSNVLQSMADQKHLIKPKESYSITLPDGRRLSVNGARLALIRDTLRELLDPDALDKNGKLRASKLRAADAANVLGDSNAKWLGSPQLRELGARIQQFDHIETVPTPEGFTTDLRPYQQDGLAWLQFLRNYNLAGILADDMGLGKTVQALAHLAEEKRSGRADLPSLVVAPTSLMANWRREAARFAPNLRVLILHGSDRKSHYEKIPSSDLVVTSYPLLARDEEILLQQPFHLAILDEAQYIKNPSAIWSLSASKLHARHRLAMTGTPMENHLGELWSIMNFLMPGYLGDERQFRRIFRNPIEKHQDLPSRSALQRRLKPFLLRRRKEQVATELPPKTEILRTVDLEGAQRDLYETVRSTMHEKIQQEIAHKGLARSHIIILDALLKLRQVCCDPRLLKIDAAKKVQDSAKLNLLMDLLPDLLAEGRRILLFSQFTSMLDLIRLKLDDEKIPYVLLTGSTSDRDTPVQQFQTGKIPLFLISLKAGGTGLNLTAADTVIHYDPWWNPAVEAQATDRAHRIGQDKNVFVYKLTTAGTVEEKILALQEKKKQLLAGILGEETAVAKLSASDLIELFAPIA